MSQTHKIALVPQNRSTKNAQNQYQKMFMRVKRSTDTQKDSVRKHIKEILKTTFETEHIVNDHSIRSKTDTPIRVRTNYKLGQNPTKKRSYIIELNDKPTISLIPFYRDIAQEFYKEYKNAVTYEQVEHTIKQLQDSKIAELHETLKRAKDNKREVIYYRILQERYLAEKVFPNAYRRFTAKELKNPQKSSTIWKTLMLKLMTEGYGYFESKIAANAILKRGVNEDFYDVNLSDTKEDLQFKIATECLARNDSIKLEAWRRKEQHDTYIKEAIYTDFRLKELQETLQKKQWKNTLKNTLEHYSKNRVSKETIAFVCSENNFNKEQTIYALKLYEKLLEKPLPKKPENSISFEAFEEPEPTRLTPASHYHKKWIKCMAIKSGASVGAWQQATFEQAAENCSITHYKTSGLQPSPKNWEKAKQFWTVGFWLKHDFNKMFNEEERS